jgi:hypothetical protein
MAFVVRINIEALVGSSTFGELQGFDESDPADANGVRRKPSPTGPL